MEQEVIAAVNNMKLEAINMFFVFNEYLENGSKYNYNLLKEKIMLITFIEDNPDQVDHIQDLIF